MIAIYPYRKNGVEIELATSLRSLLKHAKWCTGVTIVGDRPGDGVIPEGLPVRVIERERFSRDKYVDVANSLRDGSEDLGVDEHFVLMNDDFYLLADQDRPNPAYWCGRIGDYAKRQSGQHRRRATQTAMMLGQPYRCFEVHAPMTLCRWELQLASHFLRTEGCLFRTSLVAVRECEGFDISHNWKTTDSPPSEYEGITADHKLFKPSQLATIPDDWTWVSTSDRVGKSAEFRAWSGQKFGEAMAVGKAG